MRALKKGSYKTVGAEHYGTPKELWGFRSARGAGPAKTIARTFLAANAGLLGLDLGGKKALGVTDIEWQRTIRSLGSQHVIFQQVHFERRVHRAYVTVHVGQDGRVFLVKNRAMPGERLPEKAEWLTDESKAVARAKRALPKKSRRAVLQDVEEMWFPKGDKLLPSYRVRLARTRPREEWIVYVNARTCGLISKHDNLAKATRGRAWVFDPSPVTALGDHTTLLGRGNRQLRPPHETYKNVTLHGLKGNGRLEGKRVTTRPTAGRRRVRNSKHEFFYPSSKRGFEEVMVYHHIDSAIRYLERLGFRGAAAIFTDPIGVNVNGTTLDNSWYSPWEQLLTFGTGAIDDAEDGETILHEFGHAIQDAICPDFGQSAEAAAMGEGFGDYLAASVFHDAKPERYRTSVMTWDGLLIGLEEHRDPPCIRRVDMDWTYDDFIPGDDEHENGEIWSATLWDVRVLLGGEEADRLIIESHFQQDGFTTFARGARAIIDADENLNGGANRNRLRRLFRARRIGPV